ncbi:MAG: potassium channel protein [bacterium]|nr:potassium channel protein [bacterium]
MIKQSDKSTGNNILKKLRRAFILLNITAFFGIAGFYFVEGMSFFDAVYMTIITISTVGFQEVRPLSGAGRVITIMIISIGITIGAYTIGTFIRMLIEGELKKSYGRRRVEKKISQLKDHIIVCGFGRIGKMICDELHYHKKSFVVIESDPDAIEQLETDRYLYLPMDATMDESIIQARIEHARALVTAVRSDADNVFITLTAKGIRPDIFILARASDPSSEIKLKRAGASRVVCPYLIGGQRMAHVLIRPTVVDFIDIAIMEDHLGLRMEEALIKPGSPLIGKNLIENNLRKEFGVIIVLIKKYSGKMIFNPQPAEILEANDMIVVLGEKENMERMNKVI